MRGKKTRGAIAPKRTLCLVSAFIPPGTKKSGEINGLAEFIELFCEVRDLNLKRRRRELHARESNLRKLAPLLPKVGKVLQKYLADELAPEETARRVRR